MLAFFGCRWAREGPGLNEWEESWNETYKGSGYTEKHADKWAKEVKLSSTSLALDRLASAVLDPT